MVVQVIPNKDFREVLASHTPIIKAPAIIPKTYIIIMYYEGYMLLSRPSQSMNKNYR